MPVLQLKPHSQALQEPISIHYEAQGSAYLVTIGETTVEVTMEISQPGEGLLHVGAEVIPFYLARKGDLLQIWVRGKTYLLEVIQPQARRGSGAPATGVAGDIKAPMPGTVLKIQVQEGDAVEANQPLVIMESMKMEMTLAAPAAGTVQKILCSEGQLVDMGAALVQLEPNS